MSIIETWAMRFSLKELLVLFTLVAVTCAGLLYPSRFLAAIFFTAALAVILFSLMAAAARSGRSRAYWLGFAIMGGGYFVVSIFGDSQVNLKASPWNEPKLLTSEFLYWLDENLARLRPARANAIGAGVAYVDGPSQTAFVARGNYGHSLTIGHSAFSVVFGLLGASAAQRLYSKRDASETRNE
jgi:hypothetical protein